MEVPNKLEQVVIEQLRERVKDLELCEEALSDKNLVRWVRARNLKVDDAEKMLRNYVKWFDEVQLDQIFSYKAPKEVSDMLPQPIIGTDYNGCPLTLVKLGKMDVAALMRNGFKEDYVKYNLQLVERNTYFVRCKMNELNSEYVIPLSSIADMEGLSWSQFASRDVLTCVMKMSQILEAYYPESAHQYVIINATSVLTFFWRIVKPFLSERTLQKVQIYGTNRQEWEEAILKLAAKDQIPEEYGGTAPNDVNFLPRIEDCIPKKRGSY